MFKTQWTILLAIVALLFVLPSGLAEPQDDFDPQQLVDDLEQHEADCAPPCGYVWPRIGLDADVQNPFPTSKLDEYPTEIEVDITYSWDMEQEGTGLNDPTEDMEILVTVTRTPLFLRAELDRNICSFTLIPLVTEYDVCTLTLTVEIDEEGFPATENELRETGHRMMLFAMSSESGTFMTSYGLEDMRFAFDEAPPKSTDGQAGQTGGAGDDDFQEAPAPALAAWLSLTMVAVAATLLRRRKE